MTMTIASGRNEFAPPPTPGFVRALALAILAHGLLVAMLTIGVQWKRDATPVAFEAELWSAVPQEAAPPAPEEPPESIAPPEPVRPAVPVEPPRPVVVPPPPVHTPDADIALAKEKARLQKEKLLQQEKQEQLKLEQEKQKRERLEQEKQAKIQQTKLEKEKLAREKEKQDKLDKATRDKKLQEQNTKDAKDAKAADAAKQKAAAKTKEEAKQLEELRQQNLKRIAGLAGPASGNGDARSTGTAAQSSGPSAGYAGRIRALLKRNTTYTETVIGNPTAEVEVRTSPDGTVISRKLVKSSGVKSWDEAVINAIDKAAVMPRDTDGRIPSPMIIEHKPND